MCRYSDQTCKGLKAKKAFDNVENDDPIHQGLSSGCFFWQVRARSGRDLGIGGDLPRPGFPEAGGQRLQQGRRGGRGDHQPERDNHSLGQDQRY